ncbi:MAG TPA: hypothetical protein VGI60_10580 [Chthoniobacterales bacterium]|jgi:hypothetical protein
MKTKIHNLAAVLLAMGICASCTQARAQTTTTVTTTRGAFAEFVPGSETLVVRTDANPTPVQYVVTKATTVVDETGAPVPINQLVLGAPLSVQYTTAGNRLVASRVVVERTPIASTGTNVIQQSTTTTTTRPLTHDEKEALKEREEHRKKALKEEIERRKEDLEKAKDALDDHGGD